MVILSNSSPTDIGVVIIILSQSAKFKIQSSISHATEGTDTARARLIEVEARATKTIANEVRIRSTKLRRRPIEGGGEGVPIGSTDKSWVL